MHSPDCQREFDTLDAVTSGAWPDACDASLRAHVAGCTTCAEIVDVAGVLIEDRDAASRIAPIPPSGLVWWRMQLRARRDATRVARRTVVAVQAAVFFGVIGIALAALAPRLWDKLPNMNELASSGALTLAQFGLPLLLALAVWLTLAPVAVWLAVTED